ncbi:hypothetical protein B0T17DRAFT_186369 [Bombardia bombarda]|uniref:Uncharacterized protein n=1 Tax=Bombardia bombarda TaxID=252184 RepID=A0AA39X983_9PEZI|nr:hypothetical protein B0T17DRAFT_186369 [Bombardia bombarda]
MTRPAAFPAANRYTIRVRLPPPLAPAADMNTMAASTTSMGSLPDPPKSTPQPQVHNRDLALQKYLLLHEQHESLRQHLDELRPLPTSFGTATAATSPAVSPTRTGSFTSLSSVDHASPYQSRGSSLCQPYRRVSLPTKTSGGLVAVEEAKLCNVNEGIKRTLTELLNCEAVRGDRAFRTWVQCRLMDTERELRSGRKRRSAPEA